MAKAIKKAEEVEVLGTDAESFRKAFTDHIHHTLARNKVTVTDHEKFLAVAYAVRDRLVDRWIKTQETYYKQDVKRVYYLSLEFLIGRTLGNSVLNLDVESAVTEALDEIGMTLEELREQEVDAGLGNGGLGRLAACFLDSMATLELPATGMGIRYEYGMFSQKIVNGEQEEQPDNWLRLPNPWEIARPANAIKVPFYGYVVSWVDDNGKLRGRRQRQAPQPLGNQGLRARPPVRHPNSRLQEQHREQPAPLEREVHRRLRPQLLQQR